MNIANKLSGEANLNGLNIRQLNKDEGADFVRFYKLGGQTDQTLEAFHWQYLEEPEEFLWISVAEPTNSELKREHVFGAVYCIIPRRFLINGQQLLGALSLQTFTSVAYRKRGLFVHLAQTCYKHAENDGMIFVYGSPNDNSMPGFLKNLNWERLSNPKVFARISMFDLLVGKLGLTKKRKIKNYRIKEINGLYAPIDNLWKIFSKMLKISAVRDAAFWEWRYQKQPGSGDRVFVIEDNNGTILACCAIGKKKKREGERGYILDFMYDPHIVEAGKTLLDWCSSLLVREGCLLVVTCVSEGNPYMDLLVSNSFWLIPKRFHPPAPRLALSVIDKKYKEVLLSSINWHVTYGDYDTL